jgi:TolB-like protein/Flp pilus assembly protein TadD
LPADHRAKIPFGASTIRSKETHHLRYSFEDFCLDTDRRELRRGASLVAVEPKAFDLLEFLIRNRARVVSKDDLIEAIWDGRIVSESALSTNVNAARCAIGDSGEDQRLIKTLHRKGIRFVGEVHDESEGASVPTPDQAEAFALPDKPSVAVLPFTNISGDSEYEYFSDGMTEEIITGLSQCNWLFVIARNSSFTYKGKIIDVRQIGRELGVRYVLEGSVRRGGGRLRIAGQLVDATSGLQIWADRFDGEMDDVFELQDRVTQQVVAAIEPTLQLAEIERLKRKPADNFDAYDLLLRAQQLEYEFTVESLMTALRYLKQALAIDRSYAPAMALAAYCHAECQVQGWVHDAVIGKEEGLQLASRAIELGNTDANVLWMCAYAFRQLAMDANRARDLAYRSLQLNPNSAIAMTIAGWSELALANPAKALEMFQKAIRLSPRDPRGWFIAAGLGLSHYLMDQFDQAAPWAKNAVLQNPRSGVALRILAACLAKAGECEEASAAVGKLLEIDPKLTIVKWRARTMFYDKSAYEKIADGLRLAGLSEYQVTLNDLLRGMSAVGLGRVKTFSSARFEGRRGG